MNENTTRLWTKDYIFLLLAVFFAAFTHNAFTVVIPVYVNDIGGNNALTGLMMSGLMISGLITRLIFGPLIDRYGRKKILILGSTLFAINTILYCFISSLPGLFFLRIFNGISQAIYFAVPPTIVGDLAPKDRLVDGLGFFGSAASLAAAVSPMIGLKIYEVLGANSLFIITSIFTIVSAIFTFFIKEHYKVKNNREIKNTAPAKKNLKISALIEVSVLVPSAICFIISFGNSSIMNFLATTGIARGITNIGIFFLINNIVMIVTRLFTGKLSKRFGMMRLISFGCISILLSAVIIAFSFHIVPIILAAILFGVGMSIAIQLLQVTLFRFAGENRRGVANSTFMLFGDTGMGIGATVWGAVSEYRGYTLTYLLSALSIAIAYVLHRLALIPKFIRTEQLESEENVQMQDIAQ